MVKDKKYILLLQTIKERVREAQLKTVIAANSQMLFMYWQLGCYIINNQNARGWGSKIIEHLSSDLKKEFPSIKGFAPRNMLYMKQFASAYPPEVLKKFIHLNKQIKKNGSISQPLVAKLLNLDKQLIEILQQPVAKLKGSKVSTKIKQSKNLPAHVVQTTEEKLFLSSPLAKVSWSHHIIIIDKTDLYSKKFWYILNTIENGNSRNILGIQIDGGLFERQIKVKKITNFSRTLPSTETDFANYMLKDPYIFDFVQARDKADERNIEQQLSDHISKFLLELGQGFAFMGRQVQFVIGEKDFFIDLLFYHTKLHAYVVVELKSRDFEAGDAGQLNFYINLVNDKLKGPKDNDTIGILLCKGKNEILAEYALKGIKQPIGVAGYEFSKAVPAELKSQLPDIDELENSLKWEGN